MNDIDDVIEQYKRELVGEAELARDDLQEIEDHLRTLTNELRESGMSSADAVRAACVKLGSPRAIAREHAKVYSPFGARLSWARTMSAGLLMLGGHTVSTYLLFSKYWDDGSRLLAPVAMLVIFTVMTVAVLARLTWARPVVLGVFGCMVTLRIVFTIVRPDGWYSPEPFDVLPLAVLAFVMPWRRRELYSGGLALVLLSFAFGATTSVGPPVASAALVAFIPALVAIAGSIFRARWAALASAVTAALLFVSTIEVVYHFTIKYDEFEYAREWIPHTSMMLAGTVAAAIATVMTWRSARSTAGTLRYALR